MSGRVFTANKVVPQDSILSLFPRGNKGFFYTRTPPTNLIKEQNVMKKLISLVLCCLMVLSLLAGCGSAPKADGTCKIAIVQQMDHSSLDEIRSAIESQLTALSQASGCTLEYQVFNGQNDPTMLNQIGAQIVSGGFDAIIPIATLAAQCMATAADGTGIPVIFAAISDPEEAGITDLPQVTGISDALDTEAILDIMLSLQPDVKTVGLLYSNSEPNSATPIAQAKAYLEAKGIAYLEKTGNTTDEIVNAANALVGRVDAVFTPTDNVVMGAATAVEEILKEAKLPHYTGADSFVQAGAFATCGVDYTELGTQAADLAVEVLTSGQVPAIQGAKGGIILVNDNTAKAIGLDYQALFQMEDAVLETIAQ